MILPHPSGRRSFPRKDNFAAATMFLPRLLIKFTSETNTGQIYVPAVNGLLFVGVSC